MNRGRKLWDERRSPMVRNVMARVGALVSLTLVSLLVARTSGPAGVGIFVLLRVLPWIVGTLVSCGLFGAAPYFLAGPARSDPRYRPTIFAVAVVSGAVGGVLWVAASPLLQNVLFPHMTIGLVALAGITVLTQTLETTCKACSQGRKDFAGANRIIVLEELLFLPAYGALIALGVPDEIAIVAALIFGDTATSFQGWIRLARRGFFAGAGRPDMVLARRVLRFGLRAQVGTLLLLVNARLDFAIVGALVGPAALGVYAVASRYAELLRLPSLAFNYVLYPEFARDDGPAAARKAVRLIPRVGWIPAAAAIPLGLSAAFVIRLLFGGEFGGAVVPACILLLGLSGGGVSAIVTAFLYGQGRPGLNSIGMGAGLAATVVLDLLLIPPFGIVGAAVASSVAYLITTAVLIAFFSSVSRSRRAEEPEPTPASVAEPALEAVR
jgi:O-antigen/teichoic acid export membrane protein